MLGDDLRELYGLVLTYQSLSTYRSLRLQLRCNLKLLLIYDLKAYLDLA